MYIVIYHHVITKKHP